jgi:hypothetical protein
MFLTPAARDIFMRLLNLLAEVEFGVRSGPGSTADHALSASESKALRKLAVELRNQLAEDVGAANPPRLRWTRPSPPPLPSISR